MEFYVDNPLTYPKRQVHLDFHTPPSVPEVGMRFSKKNFQQAILAGNISSITVFARCYHGLCYYPTQIGVRHPKLHFDMTGAMIEAAHEIGVRAPIYVNVGLALAEYEKHPEWCARLKNGELSSGSYVAEEPDLLWPNMCLNDGSYCRHIYNMLEEICQRYSDVDGLFLDICFKGGPCYCKECRKGMEKLGLDSENKKDAEEYYRKQHIAFMKQCKKILNKYHPNSTIFFNSGGADIHLPEYHPYSTHFEIEDLPTVWGGYDKMPLNATFFSGTEKFYLGMTGKFHLEWGEFGGFKCKEALKYEIATMAVYGAGCSIGDHLIWDGEMDMETYRNIGYAYRYLEKIEPYCYGGESTATVGLWLSSDAEDNIGTSMILIENQIDFEVIRDLNFGRFEIVIFPGNSILEERELKVLNEYIEKGGKVLFAGNALIEAKKFQIDCGLREPKKGIVGGDYILASKELNVDIPKSPLYSYLSAIYTEVDDAEVYALVLTPYMETPHNKYIRHKNLPYSKDGKRYPCLSKKGNIVYLSHRIPAIYSLYGSIYHKRYFMAALNLLKPNLAIHAEIGAQGRCRMIRQSDYSRYCINMTYAIPVKRGKAEIIEDIFPLHNVKITLSVPEKITKIYLPLRNKYLSFTYSDDKCSFVLDMLDCHETIVAKYEE